MIAPSERPTIRAAEQVEPLEPVVQPRPAWWWTAYLVAIIIAELMTASRSIEFGVAAHLFLIVAIPIHAMFAAPAARPLLIALVLPPLIRVVSLAMPIAGLAPVNQYLLTSLPVAAAVMASMRVIGLSRQEIGLRFTRWPLQLGIGLLGLPIGVLAFAILRPAPIISELSWQSALLPVLVFLVLVGFLEETIFRGILQTLGLRTLGAWGIVYVSAIFASLHIGYFSPPHAGLIFLVGLVFAWLAARTRSILGVALAHGLTNIVLYVLFPLMVIQGRWSLPDVTWTGYASSTGPGRSSVGAPSAPSLPASDVPAPAVGPTAVSRQVPAAAPDPAAPIGLPNANQPTSVVVPALSPTVVPALVQVPPAQPVATPGPSPEPSLGAPGRDAPVAPGSERVVIVAEGDARVRAETSTDAPILTTVTRSAVLEIVGPDREAEDRIWRNVQLPDGRIGWIDTTLVAPTEPGASATATGLTGATAAPVTGETVAQPAPSPVPAVAAAVVPDGPVQTVTRLYDALDRADYDTLVSLWSTRMRQTVGLDAAQLRARPLSQELVLERAELASIDEAAGQAIVNVEVLETLDRATGLKRRYVGSWLLVRGETGWLVDEPSIRIE